MKRKIAATLAAAILLSGSAVFPPSAAYAKDILKYNDISGHWSEKAVLKLIDKNTLPYSEVNFMADKAITRSEFASILYKALDIQINYFKAPDIKDYFSDVGSDATYAPALIDLVTANIIEGHGKFNPDAAITREEMTHYIMNAFKYKAGDKYKMIKLMPPSFKDFDQVKPEYSGDVTIAKYYNIVNGNGNDLFAPKDNATRAEAAVIISNLLAALEKENIIDKIPFQIEIKPSAVINADSVEMKLVINNTSKNPVNISHSPGYEFDFVLLAAEKNELYRWSDGKFFIMMIKDTVINPGEIREFSYTLSGDEFNKIKDKMVYLKAYIVGTSEDFIISKDGYEIKIK